MNKNELYTHMVDTLSDSSSDRDEREAAARGVLPARFLPEGNWTPANAYMDSRDMDGTDWESTPKELGENGRLWLIQDGRLWVAGWYDLNRGGQWCFWVFDPA